jgi:hypothetical protein
MKSQKVAFNLYLYKVFEQNQTLQYNLEIKFELF